MCGREDTWNEMFVKYFTNADTLHAKNQKISFVKVSVVMSLLLLSFK